MKCSLYSRKKIKFNFMPKGVYVRSKNINRKPTSEETKRKIGLANRGRKPAQYVVEMNRKRLLGKYGSESIRWGGMKANYCTKHSWIRKHYGKATRCSNKYCPYKNPKRYEWANVSGKYLREVEDYIQLCPSCHRRMDFYKLTFDELQEIFKSK